MEKPSGIARRIFSGMRVRLLLLLAVACAPLVGLIIHTASQDRRRAEIGWQRQSQKIAQLAAQEEEKLVATTRQLLSAIAQSAPARGKNPRAVQRLLGHLYAAYPRYANLGMVNGKGEVLADAVAGSQPTNHEGMGYFQETLRTGEFTIGEAQASASGEGSVVHFGLPVAGTSNEDEVVGVVFATLERDRTNLFGVDLSGQVPERASWAEVTRQGAVVASYPRRSKRMDPRQLPLEQLFGDAEGTFQGKDAFGLPSFFAWTAIPGRLSARRTVGVLSIPSEALFVEANRALRQKLGWLGIAVVVSLGLGWGGSQVLVLRPVKALVASSRRIASGDLTARTGLATSADEFGQLGCAFDRMAESLERREQEGRRANEALHVLSRRLVEVQEAERRHIARELHDEIGQALTVAEMNLQTAIESPDGKPVRRQIGAAAEMVERVLDQVHDLSLNLRPSMLDDLGLESAVRWYANRQADLAGLTVDFQADPLEDRLDPVVETECFRIAQEALTNVVRHAHAHSVSVQLSRRDDSLHLSVRDDGGGFDPMAVRERAIRGASLGLLSMEERAALAGGSLECRSSPGHGTEVHASFPLRYRFETRSISA